jgi:hypothetical protein
MSKRTFKQAGRIIPISAEVKLTLDKRERGKSYLESIQSANSPIKHSENELEAHASETG